MKLLRLVGFASLATLVVAIGVRGIGDNEATSSPTDTPSATTPEPTERATPEPTPDAAVEAYLANLIAWLDEGALLSAGVSTIASSDNPFSVSSEAEALALSVDADAWRDRAVTFDAPAEFAEVQMWIELAGVAMADGIGDFWLGVKFYNVDLIDSATAKLGTATEYLDNATSALDAIN